MSRAESLRPARTAGMSAKEEILERLRSALTAPGQESRAQQEIPRRYQRADDKQETSTDPAKVRDVLVQRLEEYRAHVRRTTEAGLASAIAEALGEERRVIVPPGLPEDWLAELPADVTRAVDDGSAGPRELDAVDAAITGAHTAVALTGTVILRADDLGGRRAITLVPDHHIAVVGADQVVLGVPRAVERMGEDPGASWTMISGPSATSDIELERVEGVHGPRRLDVILVEPAPESEADPQPAPAAEPGPKPGPTA